LHNFCCVLLGDRVLAEDVQQQTFLEAFRDLLRFQHRSSVRSWIFTIARHRVYDALKARRRAQARTSPGDVADQLAEEPDPRPQPDESIDATRLRAALVASLRELREPVMIAVVLRFHQGFTFEEIAEVCGDSAGTHHARVTRALRQLRVSIESRIQEPASTEPRSRGHDSECSLKSLMMCDAGFARVNTSASSSKLST
jgi:RNA polymerase sigma-70 factor, ECF subfamily